MESITELPDKANPVAQHSPTLNDTNSSQTDLVMPKAPTLSPNTSRRKGSTKTAPPFSMKRAASSPNVRSMAGAEALAVAMAEKRRNKLGYHRTSVACGHCRRRKIRCLLAPEDPQGKCQNCIRLKKDCNFFPVEQHPESDQRPPSESKLDALSSEAGTSDSSSPSFTGNRGPEHFDHPNPRLKHLPSSAGHQDARAADTLSRSLTNPPTRGPSSALTYDASHNYEQNGTWAPPFLQQSSQDVPAKRSATEELPYWRPHQASMSTTYPQYPFPMTHNTASLAQSLQPSMEQTPDSGLGDLDGWSASLHTPPRSMSLIGPGELPLHYQSHYYPHAPNEFYSSTANSYMQQSNLSSNDSGMSGSGFPPLQPTGTETFQEASTQDINYVYPTTWSLAPPSESPQMRLSGPEHFTHGWYASPSALAQGKDEETGSQFPPSSNPAYMPHQANPG